MVLDLISDWGSQVATSWREVFTVLSLLAYHFFALKQLFQVESTSSLEEVPVMVWNTYFTWIGEHFQRNLLHQSSLKREFQLQCIRYCMFYIRYCLFYKQVKWSVTWPVPSAYTNPSTVSQLWWQWKEQVRHFDLSTSYHSNRVKVLVTLTSPLWFFEGFDHCKWVSGIPCPFKGKSRKTLKDIRTQEYLQWSWDQ